MPRFSIFIGFSLLLCLLLSGCASKDTTPFVAAKPGAAFLLHAKVGVVVSVDPAAKTAVIQLDDLVNSAPPAQTLLTARDLRLTPVASLLMSDTHQGRYFAVTCESGELRVGDGVYLPDPVPLSERNPMGASTPGNVTAR